MRCTNMYFDGFLFFKLCCPQNTEEEKKKRADALQSMTCWMKSISDRFDDTVSRS